MNQLLDQISLEQILCPLKGARAGFVPSVLLIFTKSSGCMVCISAIAPVVATTI